MYKTSEQIAKELAAPSLREQYVGKKASQEVAVAATPKKLSFVERTVAVVALSVAIVAGGMVTVNTAVPEYEGTVNMAIAWDTDVSSIEDAVRTVNPTATDKHVADAVEEFIHINGVNPHTIKAGTYKVPVIK